MKFLYKQLKLKLHASVTDIPLTLWDSTYPWDLYSLGCLHRNMVFALLPHLFSHSMSSTSNGSAKHWLFEVKLTTWRPWANGKPQPKRPKLHKKTSKFTANAGFKISNLGIRRKFSHKKLLMRADLSGTEFVFLQNDTKRLNQCYEK